VVDEVLPDQVLVLLLTVADVILELCVELTVELPVLVSVVSVSVLVTLDCVSVEVSVLVTVADVVRVEDAVSVLDQVTDPVVDEVFVPDTVVVEDGLVTNISPVEVVVELVSLVSFFHSGMVKFTSVRFEPAAKEPKSFPRFVSVPLGWTSPASPLSPSTIGWSHWSLK